MTTTAANVKPLGNRVLIRIAKNPTTKGGIFLPETAQEKPKQGEIVSVGPGKTDENGQLIPMSLKEGQVVLYSSYAGREVDVEGDDDYLILSEEDVLGIIE